MASAGVLTPFHRQALEAQREGEAAFLHPGAFLHPEATSVQQQFLSSRSEPEIQA